MTDETSTASDETEEPNPLDRGGRHGSFASLTLGALGVVFGDIATSPLLPAISVLSAIEGLKLLPPRLRANVVPITVAILVVLFGVQSHGTGGLRRLFGPIMDLRS